jgi:type II secretory pathway pseudopilin PulG
MQGFGDLLLGIANFVIAGIAVYNLVSSKERARRIDALEVNTNSIKDALVKVTGEAEHAKGVIQGKEEVQKSI